MNLCETTAVVIGQLIWLYGRASDVKTVWDSSWCDQAADINQCGKATDVIAADVNECRRAADMVRYYSSRCVNSVEQQADVMKLLMLWNF